MLARPADCVRPPLALARARLPASVLDVLRILDAGGHRSWLVGGAVRDLLLGRRRAGQDYDVATPARPEQVMALFPRVIPTGIEHGTVTVLQRGTPVEVTTFRGEGAYVDGRRPSSVHFLEDVDQDLARRDFTVNALAYDPVGMAFRDPFGGRKDLRRGILRAVGDPAARFAEDGLRPLRAARFAAQLDFTLDPATAEAIPEALQVASRVSAERVGEELSRLVVAPHARHGLELLAETGLLGVVLPDLSSVDPGERAHAFDAAAAAGPDLTLRFAALLHVLPPAEDPRAAARRVSSVLEGLRLPGHVREGAAALVLHHGGCLLAPGRASLPGGESEMRRWLSRVGRARAPTVLALWEADARAVRPLARSRRERATLRAFRSRLARLEHARPPLSIAELALDGHAVVEILRVPSGPAVGEALRHLLCRVLDDPRLNTRESLASELRRWWSSRIHDAPAG
jgi:tRNA nucleotidyltransferase (CCA-adding enzyme)